jgi:DNA-binding IclR family transcriptional regulator
VWVRKLPERAGRAARQPAVRGEAGGRYDIAVVSNALDLLTHIGAHGEVTTAAAAKILGLSRSTAYRILVTLQSRGFVSHDRSSRMWRAGRQLMATVTRVPEGELRSAAAPWMRRLLADEQETVNLAVFSGSEITYTYVLESPLAFRMSNVPGEKVPLHATALGKAILAAHPAAERARLLELLSFKAFTENTIVSMDRLLEEIDLTNERGWAEDHGETSLGVACFGAAVIGPDSLPLGGLSISVPEVRLADDRPAKLGRRIMEVAARISAELGYKA